MAGELGGQGFHDALVILGAAGVVIPAFARIRISPVIGFILVGATIGPAGLGALAGDHPWLASITITDRERIEPFAEIGILMLLFGIGLELSFRRLWAMRGKVFGLGGLQMMVTGFLLGLGLLFGLGLSAPAAAILGLALAMSSTALVMPLAGTASTTGQIALAILLLQDLSLVPLLLVLDAKSSPDALLQVLLGGILVIGALLLIGRFLLWRLFAQAARTKSPELFLAISLLVVMLASLATGSVGLGAVLGALIAGLLIAETDYHAEVEVITAPLRGLALGIFLITVGMRLDLAEVLAVWPQLIVATALVLIVKALVIFSLLRWRKNRRGTAVETGLLMASPSELTLIVLASALAAGVVSASTAAFWTLVTAFGLTLTPLLAAAGRRMARRVDPQALASGVSDTSGVTLIFGFGRVGRIVADMMAEHGRPYFAVDGDIDCVASAREQGYKVIFGDVARGDAVERFGLCDSAALVLTMDDPVLTVRLSREVRAACPDLTVVARARDGQHAAQLYKAGATDAVPETMEGSLQISEAVLVDIGVAMGPVIASIHEKRSQLRAQIREAGQLAEEPALGRRR
ncbi:cation:proton antiporter [Sphingomonas kaistensis]|uniref:Cation:proton antiporter n=1 Tax=Sphingomonas kaistensis TaxID=298708 RepID=A0ABZ2G547_9SPHN